MVTKDLRALFSEGMSLPQSEETEEAAAATATGDGDDKYDKVTVAEGYLSALSATPCSDSDSDSDAASPAASETEKDLHSCDRHQVTGEQCVTEPESEPISGSGSGAQKRKALSLACDSCDIGPKTPKMPKMPSMDAMDKADKGGNGKRKLL